MVNAFEWEESAEAVIAELREFIDHEQRHVVQSHDLLTRLQSWEYVLLHLDERIPRRMKKLHAINAETTDALVAIRDLVDSVQFQGLKLEREEAHVVARLEADVRHRDWRAARSDLAHATDDAERFVRLEERELKTLHAQFLELATSMQQNRLRDALKEGAQKEIAEFAKIEEYFAHVSAFVSTYERILYDLISKERVLSANIRKNAG